MKAIDGRFASGAFFTDNRCAVQPIEERMTAKIPSAQEVVFGTGAVDGRPGFTVDEKHVVTLAPPPVLILQDGHGNSGKMSATCGVQPDIIFLAIEVRLACNLGIAIALPVGGPASIGLCLPELRVKVE